MRPDDQRTQHERSFQRQPKAAATAIIPPRTSRCWRGWSRSAAGPACISAAPTRPRCTIWRPKSSTTPWTRRWPATPASSRCRWSRTICSPCATTAAACRSIRIRNSSICSALEVILTTLHSGGKFGGKVYATSGGLHGVGSSVVNALSEVLEVEVARDRVLWKQRYVRGKPAAKLVNAGPVHNRRGTTIRFRPDPQIFGDLRFSPARLYRLCRSKAYLFRGVEIRWACDPALLKGAKDETPAEAVLHFPGGLRDSLEADIGERLARLPQLGGRGGPAGRSAGAGGMGGGLARGRRGVPPLLLQHCADRAGRHARGRVSRRAAEGTARVGRAARQPACGADRARGRAGADRGEAVGVPARAAVPGPDQGEADQRGGDPAGGDGAARPVRPLAGRRSRPRRTICWRSSSSGPRSGCGGGK